MDATMLIDRRDGFGLWGLAIIVVFVGALILGGLSGTPEGLLELAAAIAVLLLTFATVAWGTLSFGTALALATSVYFVAGQWSAFEENLRLLGGCVLGLVGILLLAKSFSRGQWLKTPPSPGDSTSTIFVPSPKAGLNDYLAVLQNLGMADSTSQGKVTQHQPVEYSDGHLETYPEDQGRLGAVAKPAAVRGSRTMSAPGDRFEISLVEICRCGICSTGGSCPRPTVAIMIRGE